MRVLLIGIDSRVYAMAKNMHSEQHKVYAVCTREFMDEFLTARLEAEPDEIEKIVRFAKTISPAIIIPVSYEPSYAGVVDKLREEGFNVFGASRKGIELEADKEHGLLEALGQGIPIAEFRMVTGMGELHATVADPAYRVVKRVGFAGGKGVHVCSTEEETIKQAISVILQDGKAMIQKKIDGIPICIVWMQTPAGAVPLCIQTDYKKTYTGDLGPFCGAMGATVWNEIPKRIVTDMIDKLSPYLLSIGYIGRVGMDCMYEQSTGKLYMIEWTARFGTPTTEALLATWDADLARLFYSWVRGSRTKPVLKGKVGISIAIAGGGYPYPNAVLQGVPITVKDWTGILPIGVKVSSEKLRTFGGRHVIATGYGDSIEAAQKMAYQAVSNVEFTDMFYRTDIGNDFRDSSVLSSLFEKWGGKHE